MEPEHHKLLIRDGRTVELDGFRIKGIRKKEFWIESLDATYYGDKTKIPATMGYQPVLRLEIGLDPVSELRVDSCGENPSGDIREDI